MQEENSQVLTQIYFSVTHSFHLFDCGFNFIVLSQFLEVAVFWCSYFPFVMFLVNHGKFPKQEDSYAFEEDSSSESLSPEQPLSDESQSSAGPLAENKASSGIPSPSLTTVPTQVTNYTNRL